MKRRIGLGSVVAIALIALFTLSALATNAEIYLSTDKNGANRVTNVNEGESVWICVYDPDEDIDCDLRDKIWTDIKLMDPKTGAYIVWISLDEGGTLADYWSPAYVPYKGHSETSPGSRNFDYLEETGASTGLFVSSRSFPVGARVNWNDPLGQTHVVDNTAAVWPSYFQGGNWGYWFGAAQGALYATGTSGDPNNLDYAILPYEAGDIATLRTFFIDGKDLPSVLPPPWYDNAFLDDQEGYYVRGAFSNMDTLVMLYQDQNDDTDVAVSMAKLNDTEATLSFDKSVYKDQRGAATITVVDPDENLNCNIAEYVPVFIIVDPGAWNPVQTGSPNNFCMLKTLGGVDPRTGEPWASYPFDGEAIRWYNIYNSGIPAPGLNNGQENDDGSYYIQYPTTSNDPMNDIGTYFDTADPTGVCRIMFYAMETGPSTGVFEFDINNLAVDLGFTSLRPRDVLAAYYIDPNDEDDFKIAVAYIEENSASITSFTDANRNPKSLYWIGRDPVYVQVIDANANVDPCCPEQVVVHLCDPHNEDDYEWYILDETSSNSPIFFSNAGMQLRPVWDAMGVGETIFTLVGIGGFQLWPDNWKLEVYNEDDIYARYNDVYYTKDGDGLLGIGDADPTTAMPPRIERPRVANDVSFALMSIGDTQVYDGTKTNMYFLDRQGNRVSGYVNSDCVFVEVVDPDQNEDSYRRERIDGYWDGGQNLPFGPWALNEFKCENMTSQTNPVNVLLGDTNIFNDSPYVRGEQFGLAQLYILNPRSGRWAAIDLLETAVGSGDFVSVTCIDLVDVYTCVPTLGVLPGDTIIAVYRDPSNHSDSAWISIKVGIGGGVTPPSQLSTTTFANAQGTAVSEYTDADTVYVKVVDPSHAGASSLLDAVEIGGMTFDLAPLAGAQSDTFITAAISMGDLGAAAGDTLTATYTDPTDPTDTSSATATVIASELSVTDFYAGPNPFATTVDFAYHGSGVASDFSVAVYNLSGHMVWSAEEANVTKITWDGTNSSGAALANGAYIYIVMASDDENTFHGKGTVFIKK